MNNNTNKIYEPGYEIIFESLKQAESDPEMNELRQEIEEIDELRKLVLEINEPNYKYVTANSLSSDEISNFQLSFSN